jgi:hypothetical protein
LKVCHKDEHHHQIANGLSPPLESGFRKGRPHYANQAIKKEYQYWATRFEQGDCPISPKEQD